MLQHYDKQIQKKGTAHAGHFPYAAVPRMLSTCV